jgi:hypothetical protein
MSLIYNNDVPISRPHILVQSADMNGAAEVETIEILTEMMELLSFIIVDRINITNFRDLIPFASDYIFSSNITHQVLLEAKNVFAKNYIYDKIIKRQVNSIDLLAAFRHGIDSEDIYSILSTIQTSVMPYAYISHTNFNIVYENHFIAISSSSTLVFRNTALRCIMHNPDGSIIKEYIVTSNRHKIHSYRSLIKDIQENVKEEIRSVIYNNEVILFRSDFTNVYKRYCIVSSHAERFLPVRPIFIEDKMTLLEIVAMFNYFETQHRRNILYQ